MTAQIEQQTDALVGANKQLAERRAFIETVLQSITAGIVSVDTGGHGHADERLRRRTCCSIARPRATRLQLAK